MSFSFSHFHTGLSLKEPSSYLVFDTENGIFMGLLGRFYARCPAFGKRKKQARSFSNGLVFYFKNYPFLAAYQGQSGRNVSGQCQVVTSGNRCHVLARRCRCIVHTESEVAVKRHNVIRQGV
jgi:hypothetical protein